MKHSETIEFSGCSVLRSYTAGVIPYLMGLGFTFCEARGKAAARGHLARINKVDNLIVTAGKQMAADMLIDVVTTGLTWHAIGTGATTPAAGDTTLTTESTRLAFASRTRAGAVISLSVFYLAAQCTYNIKEAGVFGDAASSTPGSGTLFSHYLQAYDNSGGSYDLTFDYDLTIS